MSKYNKAFADYEPGTTGHVLNSMAGVGIPVNIVDSVGIGSWKSNLDYLMVLKRLLTTLTLISNTRRNHDS